MNKARRKNALLASPYIVWIAAFIIIPPVVYSVLWVR